MSAFRLVRGDTPLVISIPHTGTKVPEEIKAGFTEAARPLPDTDWHVAELYEFAIELGATIIAAEYSRYVIDLNRPRNDESLYPGQTTTGLVPRETFAGEPIYVEGFEIDVEARAEAYWRPYHDALFQTLAELRNRHGHAVLWDAHSIRSVVPRFFEGTLPDFNFGTNSGESCDPALTDILAARAENAGGYTSVVNGRFKGGYITRNYGDPTDGIHAVQLELSQATYMDEDPPYTYREDLAADVQPHLAAFLTLCRDWKP